MIFFLTKSQFALFDAPVQVAAHVRKDGTVVKPHTRIQKIAVKPHHQASLFGGDEQPEAKPKRTKLDTFIERKGGLRALGAIIASMSEDQQRRIFEELGKLGSKSPEDVAAMFGDHYDKEPENGETPDLFADKGPEPEPAKSEEPADPAKPNLPIVEHVTKKGKTLRGVVRADLDGHAAAAIDPYTFRKDGGWFIREKYLTGDAQAEPAKADTPIEAAERVQVKASVDKSKEQAVKLRAGGEKLLAEAQADYGRDRNTNTARRVRMAASAEADAGKRMQTAKTMINLANAIEDGEARYLKGISTRAAVETLDSALVSAMYETDRALSYVEQQRRKGRAPEPDDIRNAKLPFPKWGNAGSDEGKLIEALKGKRGAASLVAKIRASRGPDAEMIKDLKKFLSEKDISYNLGWWNIEAAKKVDRLAKIGIKTDDDLRLALTEFVMYRDGHKAVDPVKAAERALVGQKVGFDFFPTPKTLASTMAELAGIKPGMTVLEPSAGNGHLADAARDAGAEVDTVEVSDALRNVLTAKKHTIVAHDFETHTSDKQYDAVLMNPPFSDRKDALHIMRAWDMVKPGGKLVAIAGEGVFFGSDKKAVAFREWLDEHGADVEQLPQNTFMGADQIAQTGANARLIVLAKPLTTVASPVEQPMKNYGWDAVKLSDAYSMDELTKLREQVEAQHANAKDEGGHPLENGQSTIHLFDKEGRRKLDKLSWAVTYKLQDKKRSEEAASTAGQDDGPHDGERNADGLVFRDGRWHRDDVAQNDAAPSAAAEVEAAEDRADLAEAMAENPHSEKTKRLLADVAQKHADAEAPSEPDIDSPSSPNYRYADTGYIAGSRKELAASQVISKAKKDGAQVLITGIDWDQLEQNPREAKELITKSNLFGVVPWDKLREDGMEPGAGFLIDRIYAAIGTEPTEDKAQARQDYTLGLQTLRDRLEKCKTADDVSNVLDDLRKEYDGKILTAEESVKYQEFAKISRAAWEEDRQIDDVSSGLYQKMVMARSPVYTIENEISTRKRRGWKEKPELAEQLAAAKVVAEKAEKEWGDNIHATKSRRDELEKIRREANAAQEMIVLGAYARNKIENPLHRAWGLMGERFVNVLRFRSYKGSDAFAKHMAVAKAGKVKDWTWAEKEVTRAPRISKESARFQLKVADTYKRVGGRQVKPESTMALKEMFGLRDVQSGNWVLRDVASAKFHTEHSAEAFADLADLLGAKDQEISLNGRLALAFGARGHGAKGFKDGAARADYNAVHRVINLTKMGGGGCLAHEWFHALDNIVKEAEGVGTAGVDDYATSNPDILPPGELRDAFHALRSAMLDGPHHDYDVVQYTAHDVRVANHNLRGMYVNAMGKKILAAGNVHDAIKAIDETFSFGGEKKLSTQNKKRVRDWTRIAIAHYGGNPEGGELQVRSGPSMSSFALEAARLDQGGTAYFSQPLEMAARAFQSWVEDRLAGMGRQNDYLSAFADNKYHYDPVFGIQWNPYPEGEERERINAAFDRLFAAIGSSHTLAKALALMDAAA